MITTKIAWNKLFLLGFLLSLGAAFFIGCASAPVEVVPPGTLTITGIPEEFEGKFVIAAYDPLFVVKQSRQGAA
ncbi:hypothetical protein ACYULU_08155 [Breznakiellaceae bacterium SP9]